MSESARRLADLLIDPQEALNLEIKGWLDFATPEHQAKLAKAIIALANHGGGYVVIGFDERAGLPAEPSPGRPSSLAGYNRDRINGITERYLEPAIHCDVCHERAPNGDEHPVIVVPGGHRIPIMAKRDGPTGGELRQRAIYVRRPGPKSEEPRTAQEMSELFDRCFQNRRDEVGDLIRGILAGALPVTLQANPPRLNTWIGESCDRWAELVVPVRRWIIGRIGGFDLTCDIRAGCDDARPEPSLLLERTDFAQPIVLDGEITAVGLIARLEHALDRIDADLDEQRRRVVAAKARLAGYEPRLGETFPLQGELDDRLDQLAAIEADLAATEGAAGQPEAHRDRPAQSAAA